MTKPKSPSELNRSAYDKIAPVFAERNASMSEAQISQATRLVDRLPAAPFRILDLGCGPGRDLAWFEAHGLHVFGADLSSGMLNQARQRTHAFLSQMDMRFLGFAPASFLAVWCSAALLHLPKRQAPVALAEISRILAPGGFLSLTVQKGEGEGNEPVPYDPNIERFFARYELNEIDSLLVNAGYTILQKGENISTRHWLWYDARKTA